MSFSALTFVDGKQTTKPTHRQRQAHKHTNTHTHTCTCRDYKIAGQTLSALLLFLYPWRGGIITVTQIMLGIKWDIFYEEKDVLDMKYMCEIYVYSF